MSAQAITTQNQGHHLSQIILKLKEEFEMTIATATNKANDWISSNLAGKAPVKVLSTLAIGALLVTATVLTSGSAFADSPTRSVTLDAVSVALMGFSDGSRDEKTVLQSYASPIDFDDGTKVEKTMWRSYAAPIDFIYNHAEVTGTSGATLLASPDGTSGEKTMWQSYASPIDFADGTGVEKTMWRSYAAPIDFP